MGDMAMTLGGYRLTTVEILYHMPDHPGILQSFILQKLDIAPEFPVLRRFLDFWHREIEGPIHSVRLAQTGIISAAEMRMVDGEFRLH